MALIPRIACAVVVVTASSLGCQPDTEPRSAAIVQVRGDTTVVSITSGDSPRRTLAQNLIIGGLDGAPEEALGQVRTLDVDGSGRILIFDDAQRAIRRFGPDGRYLDQIGRPGQGPGEFSIPWDLSTSASGQILLAEYRGQISTYDAAGPFIRRWPVEGWLSPAATSPQTAVVGNDDGSIAVLAMVGYDMEDHRVFLLDEAGRVQETIVPPVPWDEIEFGHQRPALGLAWSPTGFGVAGVSSRLGFQIFRPGSARVVRVEHQADPARFAPEEREAWARYAEFVGRRQGRPDFFPAPPPEKPHFKSIVAARTGEIWVVKRTQARPNPNALDSIMGLPAPPDWIEPFEAEVYSSEGEHLATVEGPDDLQLFFASGDTVWGVVRGEFLEPYVVRLSTDRPLPEPQGLGSPK